MGLALRLALGSILVLSAARAAAYLVYAPFALTRPFETYFLEAKMVLLAYRVQAGLSLYPDWRDYPHVANFFGPVYFVVVGLLGRATGTDIAGLFGLGRAVTFASTLAIALGVGWLLKRRCGRPAALAGMLLSLSSPSLIGFSVMVRSDLMAEMLGLGGFVLGSGPGRRRGVTVTGGVLLVLAILTKQTSVVFLLAAFLALWFEGRRGRAWALGAGCSAALAVVVAAWTIGLEPNLAASLLGEGKSPWTFAGWFDTLGRVAGGAPDLLVFSVLGLLLWSWASPRELRWCSLGAVVLASSLVFSGKRGADLNYYLSLRVIEALAVGTLWQTAGAAKHPGARAALVLAAALGAVSLLPSTWFMVTQAFASRMIAGIMQGPVGRSRARTYQGIIRLAEDPNVRLLTDAGLFDLYQKERAAFGDPWLFRLLVETRQIRPVKMKRWIEEEAYDLVVTTSDLASPDYAQYAFGLPMDLAEPARFHYVRVGSDAGLFFYKRRGVRPAPPATPRSPPSRGAMLDRPPLSRSGAAAYLPSSSTRGG